MSETSSKDSTLKTAMIYVCGGKNSNIFKFLNFLYGITSKNLFQNVITKTRCALEILYVVENVVIVLCTKKEQND